jgi:ribonuclease HI/retron-type reverse transcriptase
MYQLSLEWWPGSKRTATARTRQIPLAAHEGDHRDFLRRYGSAARKAATGTKHQRREFARGLLPIAADPRTLMGAIEALTSRSKKAPGPNGLRLETLSQQERWELARYLSRIILDGSYTPGPTRRIDIPKASGIGTRPLELANAEDRVVQRALVETLQPLLDPGFSEASLGFRPGRGREHALVQAQRLAGANPVWIAEDLKDAFTQIPHGRLLDILRLHGLSQQMLELIGRTIRNGRKRGIPQGGPLSPLLLNVYCHHFLDRPWKKSHPEIHLIRVADDLLVPCRDMKTARETYAELKKLSAAAGLPLKHGEDEAIRQPERGKPLEWLGYRITTGFVAGIGVRAWETLEERLERAHEEIPGAETPLYANQVVLGWITAMGACYGNGDVQEVHAQVDFRLRRQGFEEGPSLEEFREWWKRGRARFQSLRRTLLLQAGEGFASGSARRHRETAGIGRGDGARRGAPSPTSLPQATIFTDGSCLSARGTGGWAFVIEGPNRGERRHRADSCPRATAARMELMAAVRALEALEEPTQATIVTDSEYVFLGVSEWLPRWRESNWRAGSPGRWRPLRNVRLWQRLDALLKRHEVTVDWVRGHSGNRGNEEVDRLAGDAARQGPAEQQAAARR